MKKLTVADKILAARTTLMWDYPFFASLAVQLRPVEDPIVAPTMATDGKCLWYNPDFVMSLTKPELVFVLAHEVMHNALEHHIRRRARKPGRWNKACDYVINGELVETKVGHMPKMGLIDKRFTGLGAEEVYRLLDEEAGGDDSDEGFDPGGCGAVIDACGQFDEAAIAQARADIHTKVRQAASIARGIKAGRLPASLQRLIDRLTKPVVDWRQVLRRFVDSMQTNDFTWTRPNRRFLSSGYVFPGMRSDSIAHLVVAIDTSGSIDEKALIAFCSEVNGAFGDGVIDKVTVIYADAAVQKTEEFAAGDMVDMRPAGGGGTAFSGTFRWIAENVHDASAIIYFTDLEVYDFGEQPDRPVLWAVYGESRSFDVRAAAAPWGEAISLSDHLEGGHG